MSDEQKEKDILWTHKVIQGEESPSPEEVLKCCKRLKNENEFGHVRKVLDAIRTKLDVTDPLLKVKLGQIHALCTYKDPDRAVDLKLDRAIAILRDIDNLELTRNSETLGLAGAIYKMKWRYEGHTAHLARARDYYLRGYESGIDPEREPSLRPWYRAYDGPGGGLAEPPFEGGKPISIRVGADTGYTAVNAAFVLDMLSASDLGRDKDGTLRTLDQITDRRTADEIRDRRKLAAEIRRAVIDILPTLAAAQIKSRRNLAAENRDQRKRTGKKIDIKPPIADFKKNLLKNQWWYWVTLADAAFGLGDDKAAIVYLRKGANLDNLADWEIESSVRQLAELARIRDVPGGEQDAWKVIHEGFQSPKNDFRITEAVARSVAAGKFGLALSGGGFRASLYHIGVLARLAEIDALRHVEVISCVSGGSIIGAYYYLKLRQKLEDPAFVDEGDAKQGMTREVYIQIVKEVETEFLAGVQENIRMMMVGSFLANLRMIFQPGYSRTRKIGELFETELYARILSPNQPSPRQAFKLWRERFFGGKAAGPTLVGVDPRYEMRKLRINPSGPRWTDFNPKVHNWRRSAKVPTLILNSTTLNTGHNWQFTASFLGEPPGAIVEAVDGNERLRRLYYKDAPPGTKRFADRFWSLLAADGNPPKPFKERLRALFSREETDGIQSLRLGQAVAASACVPGLFEPISINGVYADRVVRLVDGGVHDNQGVVGLLEQNCTLLMVSDACGQLGVLDQPEPHFYSVAVRSNDVLMERVRWAQFRDLSNRARAGVLRGLLYVHLKQDLDVDPIDWIDCQDQSPPPNHSQLTNYGVRKDVQRLLSGVRTDLDSFSDLEAFALMTSGYLATRHTFDTTIGTAVKPYLPKLSESPPTEPWKFLAVKPLLQNEAAAINQTLTHKHLETLLGVSSGLFFKVWKLVPWLRKLAYFVAVLAVAGFLYFTLVRFPDRPLLDLTLGKLGYLVVFFLATTIVSRILGNFAVNTIWYGRTLQRMLIGIVMALGGFLLVKIHRWIFNPWYLSWGRVTDHDV